MSLPFLNRQRELARLRRLAERSEGALAVLYGRRRCGKSRLLLESFPDLVYYLADESEPALQRALLAREIGRRLVGFDLPTYPDWDALLASWWERAPQGSILGLDEFPTLVQGSPELPSVLQRYVDRSRRAHLVLSGSSQRMMEGLVLDRTAPLYGRAAEILRIEPLRAGWVQDALGLAPVAAVEAYSVWGGVPRYWELAAGYASTLEAAFDLVLDPLGVLHEEPLTLLKDDLRDTAQSAAILQLIGLGCHRMSEIGARLEKPATALARPLQRLLELGLAEREHPFESAGSKRTLYKLADPFLRFWFRYVGPARSTLRALGPPSQLERLNEHTAGVWEDLARASVPHLELHGLRWRPASRWWGQGPEVDIVAESVDGSAILVGSAKWEEKTDVAREAASVGGSFLKAGKRRIFHALWLKHPQPSSSGIPQVGPEQVLAVLR